MFHASQQIDTASEHLLCVALEPVDGCYTSHLYWHTGLLQKSTEGVPVSLSGHRVADHSTSEELFKEGYSKVYNINIIPNPGHDSCQLAYWE